jgi:hypothetical protein
MVAKDMLFCKYHKESDSSYASPNDIDTCRNNGILAFIHHPVFLELMNTRFWKMDPFLSSGKVGKHI